MPGNFTGPVLEMTIVLDCNLSKEYISETAKDTVATLKTRCGEVFRNVRLNTVWWNEDCISNEVSALTRLQMQSYFERCDKKDEVISRNCAKLMDYLKRFHARSKLIIIISDDFIREDTKEFRQALEPFLGRKTLLIKEGICYDLHRDF